MTTQISGTYLHPSATRKIDDPLLVVDGLKTYFNTESGEVRAVDGVSFTIAKGETLGIVGESGSGKSVTAFSIMRLIPEGQGRIVEGSMMWYGGEKPFDIVKQPIDRLSEIRGDQIAMIFQEPMTSLNPVFKCGWQIAESLRFHAGMDKAQAWKRGTELLDEVGIPMPAERMNQYPHELSGGMKQRVMIAIALACDPKLLICDEPTTALDVTIQRQILDLILQLQRDRGMAVLFITHDLGVVAEITDRVAVMCPGETLQHLYEDTKDAVSGEQDISEFARGGHIVEFGSVLDIFDNAQHPYTKGLIACRPTLKTSSERLPTIEDFIRAERAGQAIDPSDPTLEIDYPGKATERRENMPGFGQPLLEIKGLRTWFPIRKGVFQRTAGWVKAVDGVDLVVPRGKTIGLVGESGCGKTTLGRSILRLEEPREGSIIYDGKDVMAMSGSELRGIRRKMQIIFQDPYSSLNPRLSIEETITEPMRVHKLYGSREENRQHAVELMERVGLKAEHLDRYPHEFSGGQRQRICVARTLAVKPEFIVCDESVSALDVSIQAEVINLLLDLQDEMGLTYIFITHDLSVVKYVADEVAVMSSCAVMKDLYEGAELQVMMKEGRGGHIVEYRQADELYARQDHPYTRKLLSAIPAGDVEGIRRRMGVS